MTPPGPGMAPTRGEAAISKRPVTNKMVRTSGIPLSERHFSPMFMAAIWACCISPTRRLSTSPPCEPTNGGSGFEGLASRRAKGVAVAGEIVSEPGGEGFGTVGRDTVERVPGQEGRLGYLVRIGPKRLGRAAEMDM